jgi:superoxide reductase
MTEKKAYYFCEKCGNVVEVVVAGAGTLVCCGEPMKVVETKTADSSTEKHVPVIEKIDGGYRVFVGSTLHPMTDEHYIQWIELLADGKTYRQYLKPGETPEAFFKIEDAKELSAREYCNLHGLWKG